ncbi:MAG TPA: MFS transporter [Casimicrobiaceae bacterium]|nr:MFS transporter [Casimicrobiaceae bacterium]
MTSKPASVAIIAVTQVAAMALWFSASAVVPSLAAEYGLSNFMQAAFTGAVQVGFVIGCLASALLGLADRMDPRRLFAVSAAVGASANALLLAVHPASVAAPLLRVLTGACMAGVYPVGMKLAATWAKGDMGLMVGLLVGALTLGSASPHLFNALGGVNWRITLGAASASALAAALLIGLAGIGPNRASAPRFDPHYVLAAWREVPLRLANLGYLGHMWELYAMWAWIGAFLNASFALSLPAASAPTAAKLAAFATVASGAIGCVGAGFLADRLGRTTLTIIAMAVSGSCAATVGLLFGGAPWALLTLCIVWGISIVADSAQFSASIAELSDPARVGTMLTLQTALGFTLTLATIHLLPHWVDALGWRYAFVPLSIGPALGVWAMARLRARPEAVRLAGGRR